MRTAFVLLIALNTSAWSSPLEGTLNADWTAVYSQQNKEALVDWTAPASKQTQFNIDTTFSQNELTLEIQADETSLEIEQLVFELSSPTADWTIGRKPQTWGYAYSDESLNWLQDDVQLLREHYFSFGSVQTYCSMDADLKSQCGARAAGWWENIDWQTSVRRTNHWETAIALQTQWLAGGLSYIESSLAEKKGSAELTQIAPDIYQVTSTIKESATVTTGLQWSAATNTAFLWEANFQSNALTSSDWNRIKAQLSTDASGLVAPALSSQFGRWQHIVRVSQTWDAWSTDATWVYWPEAFNSWLVESTITHELNSRVTLSFGFQHTDADSVLGLTGTGQEISFRINFTDGLYSD